MQMEYPSAKHVIVRTASVVSPFYSLIPAPPHILIKTFHTTFMKQRLVNHRKNMVQGKSWEGGTGNFKYRADFKPAKAYCTVHKRATRDSTPNKQSPFSEILFFLGGGVMKCPKKYYFLTHYFMDGEKVSKFFASRII